MAVNKVVTGTSMTIEVQKGTDKAGDPVYSKKSFPNLRNDVDLQNSYDVAEAIKGLLDANSRNDELLFYALIHTLFIVPYLHYNINHV